MPGEPLPSVVEMQHVLTSQAKSRKSACHPRLFLLLWLVGARHADHLETDDTAREVAAAVGTADTGVDAGGKKRVSSLHGRGRRGG